MKKKPFYYIEYRGGGLPICFPEGYDTSELEEISSIGKSWATFLNVRTGDIISCEDFYKKLQEER